MDTFTIKLEHERRQDILLSEQIRIYEEDIKRRKERQGSALSATTEEKKLKQKIAAVLHETRLVETSIADTQTYNRTLMAQVEGYRREHTNYKAAIKNLTEKISQVSEEAVQRNGEYLRCSTASSKCRTSIEQLRSKSAHERLRQVTKLQELSTVVKDDLSAKGSFFRTLEENFKLQMKRSVETTDPIPIQQALIQKWKDKLSEITAEFDHYIRHIKVLMDAFHSIEAATSISNLREIVTTIIKTEEQHYNLCMQLNTLSAETDLLEEALSVARDTTQRLRSSREKGEQQATAVFSELTEKVHETASVLLTRGKQLENIKSALTSAFSFIQVRITQDLQELFSAAAFQDIRRKPSPGAKLTAASVMMTLADIEQSIITLLVWHSYVSSSSAKGLLSSLAIGRMSEKRFELAPILVNTDFLTTTIAEDDDASAVRVPLREEDFRNRVKKFLEQRPVTPSNLKLLDSKKAVRTPH